MTDRLDEEIRSALGSMIAEAPEPMELHQLAMQAAIATVPRQRRSPLPAIAVAFAAVVVAVGGISLLASSPDDGAGSVTATTARPDLASSSVWSRIPHDEAVFGEAEMSSVTVGGPGLVAVGTEGPPDTGGGAVWTSTDGITWTRTHLGSGGPSSVTVGGPGLVAVGWARSGADESAAVWASPDGLVWSRVPGDDVVFKGVMNSVTAGGPSLVAVGSDGMGAAAWTSADGITWSRVAHDETVFGAAEGLRNPATMNSVTQGGPGLVAVGSDGLHAAVWTSVDGITWSRIAHDETVFGGATFCDGDRTISSVTAGGPGLVAVGSDRHEYEQHCGAVAAVWTSVDGITWSRVPHDERVFGSIGPYAINDVTATDSGLVAVGSRDGDTHGSALVWTSPDGITWSQLPHDETALGGEGDQMMKSVTANGSGLVAVGSDRRGSLAGDAAVWTLATRD